MQALALLAPDVLHQLEPTSLKLIAIVAFFGGLLLAVRVMFFGVQRRTGDELRSRRWPLSLAAFLVASGAMFYARSTVTGTWLTMVFAIGLVAAAAAWWLVQRSAAIPSTDPEDDPRYRFQGHVARIIEAIEGQRNGTSRGRIAFEFDGKRYELRARWMPGDWDEELGRADREVVIEHVDGEVAYVEPWAVVEQRL